MSHSTSRVNLGSFIQSHWLRMTLWPDLHVFDDLGHAKSPGHLTRRGVVGCQRGSRPDTSELLCAAMVDVAGIAFCAFFNVSADGVARRPGFQCRRPSDAQATSTSVIVFSLRPYGPMTYAIVTRFRRLL